MTALDFDERVASRIGGMSPAERRVVAFFRDNREEVLIASAVALAARTKTSDATVVRAAKALGFIGLNDLRRALADELRNSLALAARLTRTLEEVGGDLGVAFETTLDIHIRSLEDLRLSVGGQSFRQAVAYLAGAKRVVAFGIGPSSALADYLVRQVARFGVDAISLSNCGLLFADDLHRLRKDDVVVMLAYGRVYIELETLLDEVEGRKAKSILLTDTLAAMLRPRVDLVLPVARGRADMLSMHTATLGLIEALLVGLATRRPAETLTSLRALNETRARLAGKPAKLRLADDR